MKKRFKGFLTIRFSFEPGRCRWCRCTYERPCANGCAWADRAQTLCTECVPLDTAVQSVKGRRELAEFLQEHVFCRNPDNVALPANAQRTARRRA